jgi:hypothetical protein
VIVELSRSANGDPAIGLWVTGGIVLVTAAAFAANAWRERKRRQALADVAPSLGMDFTPGDDVSVAARLGRLPLFDRGRAKRASNVMRGTSHGRTVAVFDYHYKTGSGKHTHHHRQTVAHLRVEGIDLPPFWMRRQGFMDKLASLVGMRDIDFGDDEAFSRRWHLKAHDEAAVRRSSRRVRSGFDPERPIAIEGPAATSWSTAATGARSPTRCAPCSKTRSAWPSCSPETERQHARDDRREIGREEEHVQLHVHALRPLHSSEDEREEQRQRDARDADVDVEERPVAHREVPLHDAQKELDGDQPDDHEQRARLPEPLVARVVAAPHAESLHEAAERDQHHELGEPEEALFDRHRGGG